MSSDINTDAPLRTQPSGFNTRQNFIAAKAEIEALQAVQLMRVYKGGVDLFGDFSSLSAAYASDGDDWSAALRACRDQLITAFPTAQHRPPIYYRALGDVKSYYYFDSVAMPGTIYHKGDNSGVSHLRQIDGIAGPMWYMQGGVQSASLPFGGLIGLSMTMGSLTTHLVKFEGNIDSKYTMVDLAWAGAIANANTVGDALSIQDWLNCNARKFRFDGVPGWGINVRGTGDKQTLSIASFSVVGLPNNKVRVTLNAATKEHFGITTWTGFTSSVFNGTFNVDGEWESDTVFVSFCGNHGGVGPSVIGTVTQGSDVMWGLANGSLDDFTYDNAGTGTEWGNGLLRVDFNHGSTVYGKRIILSNGRIETAARPVKVTGLSRSLIRAENLVGQPAGTVQLTPIFENVSLDVAATDLAARTRLVSCNVNDAMLLGTWSADVPCHYQNDTGTARYPIYSSSSGGTVTGATGGSDQANLQPVGSRITMLMGMRVQQFDTDSNRNAGAYAKQDIALNLQPYSGGGRYGRTLLYRSTQSWNGNGSATVQAPLSITGAMSSSVNPTQLQMSGTISGVLRAGQGIVIAGAGAAAAELRAMVIDIDTATNIAYLDTAASTTVSGVSVWIATAELWAVEMTRYAAFMNTSITGSGKLAVFDSTGISNVTIIGTVAGCPGGMGQLEYAAASGFRWKAPGDSFGGFTAYTGQKTLNLGSSTAGMSIFFRIATTPSGDLVANVRVHPVAWANQQGDWVVNNAPADGGARGWFVLSASSVRSVQVGVKLGAYAARLTNYDLGVYNDADWVGTRYYETDVLVNGLPLNWTGTAWVDGEGCQWTEVVITSGQLLALNATPQTIVATPGSGKALIPLELYLHMPYNSVAYAGIGATEDLALRYTGSAGTILMTCETTGFLDQTANQFRWVRYLPATDVNPTVNAPLVLHMQNGEITTGNSTLKVRVKYRTVNVAW